jgi:hypothetical protein
VTWMDRWIMSLEKHKALTAVRAKAYGELFGCKPSAVFPPHALFKKPDERFVIDILVYTLETELGDIDVAVTNGMSDQRMADPGHPHEWRRRELIQYFPNCTEGHARRLHDMAWLPLFDGFYLDSHHSVAWVHPAVEGTPWKNAFFLLPLIRSHREFVFEVEGDKARLFGTGFAPVFRRVTGRSQGREAGHGRLAIGVRRT